MANVFRSLRGGCPVCNGARLDCRKNLQTELIHCRYEDFNIAPGFRFVGQDSIGFNMWSLNNGNYNNRDWQTYQQRAAERERRLQEEAKRYDQSLSADERDLNIRRISQHLGLATQHRQNLRDRGLTDAQIDDNKFFTIAPWQEVPGIDPNLAGVDLCGRRLLTSNQGFACPIWDTQGRVIGWQTRLDNCTYSKYRWPTSRTKNRPHGSTAHLQNGELPITCCRPFNGVKRDSIGLAEGTLKPYIAAQKLGQVVLGAAGGNFESSKRQLEEYLILLSAELETRTVDLYPDAAAVANKTVMRQYRRIIKLVTEWGYLLRVAWWGQLTKKDPDIDELTNFDALTYLTPKEFLRLAPGCDTESSSPRLECHLKEPSPKAYAEAERERVEWERVELAEEEFRGFGKVKQFLKRLIPKRLKFELPPPKKLARILKYTPGNLPWSSAENCPKILYAAERLPQLLAEAREKGWRDILDTSPPGAGKSFRYAILPSSALGVDNNGRTWLLSQSHRNPTTAPAEQNFADMPVRTCTGFVEDTDRKTETGKPYLRSPTATETNSLHKGNCSRANLIHSAVAKGIDNANESSQINLFCTKCKHGLYCGERSGSGFGYRYERRELFENKYKIRSSIDSLAEPHNYSYEQDVVILDEALVQLKPVQTIRASIKDFAAQWEQLEYRLPKEAAKLARLKTALASLLREVNLPYQGLNHEQLLCLLPTISEDFVEDVLNKIRVAMTFDLAALLSDGPTQISTQAETKKITSLKVKIKRRFDKLQKLQAELTELQNLEEDLLHAGQQIPFEKFWGLGYTGTEPKKLLERLKKLPEKIAGLETELAQLRSQLDKQERDSQTVKNSNRRQYQQAKQSLNERIEDLPNQFLVPFLEVWSGSRRGAVRISPYGELTVTVTSRRHNHILNSVGLRCYLDATASPEMLALYRQIPIAQILQVEQETSPLDNLDFVWVTGFGLAGKHRSRSCDERLKSLHQFFKKQHPDLAIFDWKAKKEVLGADGHYYSDSTRGSNEFVGRSAIAAIGLPMPDLASYYDLWLTVNTNGSLSFDNFYHQLIDTEIVQAVGRLRAIRRPNEKLTFYLVGDTEKCRIVKYQPPAQLKPRQVKVFELCAAAASKSEQAWLSVREVVRRWWTENGQLPTQEQVSKQTGINRSWISKLAAQFVGGWRCLKMVIQYLVDLTYNRWNLVDSLPEDSEWIAKTYLPLVAQNPSLQVAQELNTLLQTYGWQSWLRILSQTSQSLRLSLIVALFQDGLAIQEVDLPLPIPIHADSCLRYQDHVEEI